MDPINVILAARRQFEKELFDDAVKKEVATLRKQADRSLWQRLLDKLPFVITITRRNQ